MLDRHVHLDLRVRRVAIDFKVIKLEIVNVFQLVSVHDLQRGKGAWLTTKLTNENEAFSQYISYNLCIKYLISHLCLEWFYVISVDMCVSECVDEVTRLRGGER